MTPQTLRGPAQAALPDFRKFLFPHDGRGPGQDQWSRASSTQSAASPSSSGPDAHSPSMQPDSDDSGRESACTSDPRLIWIPAPIMAAALCLLLGVATPYRATMSLPDAGREATPPVTHIQNLRVDPAQRALTWDVIRSGAGPVDPVPGWKFMCKKEGGKPILAHPGRHLCSFPTFSLCHPTRYTVYANNDSATAASVLFPAPDPDRGAAAQNLSCLVHDVDLMTCAWERGPGAGDSVQYRMFWRDSRLGPAHDRECPRYAAFDDHGAHVRCALDLGTDPAALVTVTVNASVGSSNRGPCSDLAVDLPLAEVLTPPTLTAECNASEALLRWDMRSRFHRDFKFMVQINKSSPRPPQEENVSDLYFRVLNPGALSVRVRALAVDGGKLSAWSEARGLACNPEATSATVTTSLILVLLGAGLMATLLHWRKSLLACLFPPIPRMRISLGPTSREMVAWAPPPEDCETTPVTEAGAAERGQ